MAVFTLPGRLGLASCFLCVALLAVPVGSHQSKHPEDHHKLDLEREREHIQEHLEDIVPKREEKMTEDELHFHYFKLHDYNDDDKLDGCELFKAMSHDQIATADDEHHQPESRMKPIDIKPIVEGVDEILANYDTNGDGYVSYLEYKRKMSPQD